jgi:hypothetical protein
MPWNSLILAKRGHGVLSVKLVNALSRRHQDQRNLADQIKAENKWAAGNSWEHLTVDMVRLDAARTDLSNNQVMRLGKERLA